MMEKNNNTFLGSESLYVRQEGAHRKHYKIDLKKSLKLESNKNILAPANNKQYYKDIGKHSDNEQEAG